MFSTLCVTSGTCGWCVAVLVVLHTNCLEAIFCHTDGCCCFLEHEGQLQKGPSVLKVLDVDGICVVGVRLCWLEAEAAVGFLVELAGQQHLLGGKLGHLLVLDKTTGRPWGQVFVVFAKGGRRGRR